MGSLMAQVVRKVNTVLEKLDAIEDKEPNRSVASARSMKSAGARSLTSARGKNWQTENSE